MIRRRTWIVAAVALLVMVAGDVAYWRIAVNRLRTGYQDWLAVREAEGWTVASGPLSVGGWPRAATLNVPNLTLRRGAGTLPGNLNVASAGILLSVSLFSAVDLDVTLTGPLHVRIDDAPDVIVTGDQTLVSVPLQQAERFSAVLLARGLRLEAASGAWHMTIGLLNARGGAPVAPPADGGQPVATFSVSSEAIALPGPMKWPLGSNISSLSLDGRLNGALPGMQNITAWAEHWRDAGGSLEIAHLAMGWGPLGVTGSATLALDDQLQPQGSGSGRIVGYAATLDRLAAGGVLTKSAATAAKAVLSLMAGTGEADEPPSVDVPLTLQYRTLSMRQIPLLRLPELDWPAR